MNTIKRLVIVWYWDEITDILKTIIISAAVFGFCQAIKYIADPSISPNDLKIVSYHLFNILSWPSRISMAVSAITFIIKGAVRLYHDFRSSFGV